MIITQWTKLATGSLVVGKPFNVFNDESYINITAARVAEITAYPEVLGAWNIQSTVPNGPNFDLTLYNVRFQLAADALSRPTNVAITAAEATMASNATLAGTKQAAHYATHSVLATPIIGTIAASLSNNDTHDVIRFETYMNGGGFVVNGKGRITAILPVGNAPIEYSHILTVGNVWMTCAVNPQWADFIA